MRSPLAVLVVIFLAAAGCESVERIEIRADGSATLATSIVIDRDSSLLELLFFVEYDDWVAPLLEQDVEDEQRFFTDLGDLEPFRSTSNTVELVLPDRIVAHDAHEVSGNTLRWTWTVGEVAGPGISVTWDPLGEPDGGFTVRAFVALGLVVLLGLGMLAVARSRRKPEPVSTAK